MYVGFKHPIISLPNIEIISVRCSVLIFDIWYIENSRDMPIMEVETVVRLKMDPIQYADIQNQLLLLFSSLTDLNHFVNLSKGPGQCLILFF